MQRAILLVLMVTFSLASDVCNAQPDDFQGVVAGPKPALLWQSPRRAAPLLLLPKKSKLTPLEDFHFLGPRPSHPFVLGEFETDGRWGLINGSVGVVDGKNAALQLAWAEDFVLDGTIEQFGLGGWFMLVGWDEGQGYAISNVVMKESGSPWFVSEFVDHKSSEDLSTELEKFLWQGEKPFQLRVEEKQLSLTVGPYSVVDRFPLENYQPGRIILGTYDTRYGPRQFLLKSLKIQTPSSVDDMK